MALISSILLRDEEGQGLAEYALILALIAIIAIVALIFLGGQVSKILSAVGNSVYQPSLGKLCEAAPSGAASLLVSINRGWGAPEDRLLQLDTRRTAPYRGSAGELGRGGSIRGSPHARAASALAWSEELRGKEVPNQCRI